MASFTFIHTADIHLDSPLRGLSKYEGAPVDLLRSATREAFTGLIDEAINCEIDFMVISGDLYDGDWKDYNTGLFFSREMGRLSKVNIPVFLIYGNHDAESEITKQLSLPKNVKAFSAKKPETYYLDPIKVALHGQSFLNAETTENLAINYPGYSEDYFNIGVLHTAVEGDSAHARYAPCSLDDLKSKGYDYWALGHVHTYKTLCEDPWIIFSGNLQGRHIRETGPCGAVLATVNNGQCSVERIFKDTLRWYDLTVDVNAAKTLDDVVQLAKKNLEALLAGQSSKLPKAVRVTLVGRTSAHGELFGLESQLRLEILSQANALGDEDLWIEKVCTKTMPDHDPETLAARSDAIHDLQEMLEDADKDTELMQHISDELQDLVSKAPKELIDVVPELEEIRKRNITELIKSVSPGLIARLECEN